MSLFIQKQIHEQINHFVYRYRYSNGMQARVIFCIYILYVCIQFERRFIVTITALVLLMLVVCRSMATSNENQQEIRKPDLHRRSLEPES